MQFPLPINILDLILKGMLIGIVASAPMGPVGVLCVQRTINKGRWFGFVTGVGAACSDIFYAMITGFGMSFVMDLITNHQNRFYLQILGSFLLFGFGYYCFRSNPTKKIHVSGNKGSLFHNGLTAFIVTLSNPLILFLFMACYAQFAFVIPDHPLEMSLGYLSIFARVMGRWRLSKTVTLRPSSLVNKYFSNAMFMVLLRSAYTVREVPKKAIAPPSA